MEQRSGESLDKRNDLAQERTDLALIRTVTAAERTLMAWVRTSLAMIGFGFSIYKFFEYFAALPAVGERYQSHAPRNLGLAFIALGTLVLSAAVVEHVILMKRLSEHGRVRLSLVIVVSGLMIFLGVLAFLGVIVPGGPF